MATIINTPGQTTESDSGVGVIVGVILAIIIIALLAIYGIPALRGTRTTNVNLSVPTSGTPAASVNTTGGTGNASGGTGY